MVDNSSKCVFVLISMLRRVKNSRYSSCSTIKIVEAEEESQYWYLPRPCVHLWNLQQNLWV